MENVLAVCVAVLFVMILVLLRNVKENGASIRKLEGAGPVPGPGEPAGPESALEEGISPEVVAAISAAVFCAYPGARIASLRRAPDRPCSAWRSAGLWENTRPF